MFQFPPLDAPALAGDLDKEIVQPLTKADALFHRYPKLTRLATFISPEEMNVDPIFAENPTLPDVPLERHADGYRACGARAYARCEAPVRLELPGGQKLWFKAPEGGGWCGPPTSGYDRAAVDQTPALAIAWQRDLSSEGVIRLDNSRKIATGIGEQNETVWPGCGCAVGGRDVAAGAVPFAAALAIAGSVLVRRRRRR
jgi:MYXO-CTERM domain-containing protein